MIKQMRGAGAVALACVTLSGCSTLEGSERLGTWVGAGVGGLAVAAALVDHSGTTTTVLGGVAGALIGSQIGKRVAHSIYERDLQQRDLAYRRALGQYAHSGWNNPDTQSTGEVSRTSAAWQSGDEVCASFQESYRPQGKEILEPIAQTACLSQRGWRRIS